MGKTKKEKSEIIKLVRLVCMVATVGGFLFQSSKLLLIYFSGKTAVEIRMEENQYSKLPAITICVPALVSMKKLAQKYPQYEKDYNNYVSKGKSTDKEVHKEIDDIYSTMSSAIYSLNVSIGEAFENLSIDSFRIDLLMIHYLNTSAHFNRIEYFPREQRFSLAPLPIQVPFIYGKSKQHDGKCFTMFSDRDHFYYNMTVRPVKFIIQIKADEQDFPLTLKMGRIFVSLHDPKDIPESNFEFFRLTSICLPDGPQPCSYKFLKYSETRIRRLPAPYETKCENYGQNYRRGDCLVKCHFADLRRSCHLDGCLYLDIDSMIGNLTLDKHLFNLPLCSKFTMFNQTQRCVQEHTPRIQMECQARCRPNCEEVVYNVELIQQEERSLARGHVSLMLDRAVRGHQVIEYKPLMSWIEVVSNFGGLLGMWLGVSVAFAVNYIFDRISI